MTIIKNQTQLLTAGANGEAAAKVAGHAVTFTRVSVGDANGVLPPFDLARTALDNHVKDGAILSHTVDENNADQRKLVLRIAPDFNYGARELLVYATANGIEFPHTYIRLGSVYPIRTADNDGIQVTIETYIKVSSETTFDIKVLPGTDFISRGEFDAHNHDAEYLGKTAKAESAKTADKLGGITPNGYAKRQSLTIPLVLNKWTRIAILPMGRATARFILGEGTSGYHGRVAFEAGIAYGRQPFINVTSNSGYSGGNGGLKFLRIMKDSSDPIYGEAWLEVYSDITATAVIVMLEDEYPHESWQLDDAFNQDDSTKTEAIKVDLDLTTGFISSDKIVEQGQSLHDKYLGKTAKAESAKTADKLGGIPAVDYLTFALLENNQTWKGVQTLGGGAKYPLVIDSNKEMSDGLGIQFEPQGTDLQTGYLTALHSDDKSQGACYSFQFSSNTPKTSLILKDGTGGSGGIWEGLKRVYSPNNKPKPSDVGAYSISEIDTQNGNFEIKTANEMAKTKGTLHVFLTHCDLQIPDNAGNKFQFIVDDSVNLSAGKCRLIAPLNKKIKVSGIESDACNIKETGVIHTVLKVNGVWKV